jgi:hypothetical protein
VVTGYVLAAGEIAAQVSLHKLGAGGQNYEDSVKLLKSLGADQMTISRIRAQRKALRLLYRLHYQIAAVADALLAQSELSGPQIDEIISRAR